MGIKSMSETEKFASLKLNKIYIELQKSPLFPPHLIIGMKISLWYTNSTIGIANELWRSDKKLHPLYSPIYRSMQYAK
jgi:hypothetical protein